MEPRKTITFRKPITVGQDEGKKTYESLQLREPTAAEYEAAEKISREYGMAAPLIASVSGMPLDVIDQMFESQFDEAEDFLGSFGASLVSPKNASPNELQISLVSPVRLTEDESALNVSTLNLCEPTNLQRRKSKEAGGPVAQAIELISLNARIPRASVRAMCARDFLAATGYFNGFQLRRRADRGG